MDFTLGLATGFFLWPAWVMGIFGLIIVAEIIFCAREEHAWGFIVLLVGTIVLGMLGGSWTWHNFWGMVVDNAWNITVMSTYYLAVGAVWSIAKWGIYSLKLKREFLENVELHKAGKHWRERDEYGQLRQNHPNTNADGPKRPESSYARNSKERLTGWVALWPFSMLSTFIGDFLSKVFENIVKGLQGIYNGISDLAWKDVS